MITCEEALNILTESDSFDLNLLNRANEVRKKYQGDKVDLCSIINVKSGRCSEDCAYCAQSSFHHTDIKKYALLSKEEVLDKARLMEKAGAKRFALVSSGRGLTEGRELDKIVDILYALKQETNLHLCASLGIAERSVLCRLKEAGVSRYHHNLETAASYYPSICTTHTFAERVNTVIAAKEAGLSVCSGVILGLGESRTQRIEVAESLRNLKVDSVPINILNPLPGTKLEKQQPLEVWEILKTLAVYRLMLPETNLRLCGGRELRLGDFQALAMLSGINGLMLGNYLTTKGRTPEIDLLMLKELGFTF